MRKLYILAAAAAFTASATASSVSLDMLQTGWRNSQVSQATLTKPGIKTLDLNNATRSAEEPQFSFTATNAEFYYYGDLLDNGTGVYMLWLANTTMEKGMPTGTGQMARLELIADQTDPSNPQLCTGTFKVMPAIDQVPEAGTLFGPDSDVLDVFPNPDAPEEGLVAYSYEPSEGTLTIEKEGDVYKISYDLTVVHRDIYSEEIDDTQQSVCSYEGECTYVDLYAYTPFDGDINLDELIASGRYTDGGDYSIAFTTPGMLDDEGWIVAPGYLLNAELFVEDVAPMNVDDLVGTFTPNDLFTNGAVPGTFGEGVWYPIFGSMYAAILTSVSEYDESGSEARTALAKEGTITCSKEGDNYKMVFDLISAEGNKITAVYEGDLEAAISDFSTPVSVNTIGEGKSTVVGGRGCITAPADAEIFSLSGVRCGCENLPAGIYLVKTAGKTHKVMVK